MITDLAFVLASNSPRRKQLLSVGGWKFRILPADIDETPQAEEEPAAYVMRVAESKARAVMPDCLPDEIVIAADTTVADQGKILGKPVDAADAAVVLAQLRGHSHQVITALAVIQPMRGEMYIDLAYTEVPMRDYTEAEIQAYIATGDPFDKAGSYAIQHPEFHPVENLQGCYANVVGLPLCHLERTLRKMDILPQNDVPKGCQNLLGYQCSVFEHVLQGEI